MAPQENTEVRNKRMIAALNMEKPDRIPISLSGQMYYKFIDPTMPIADWFKRQKLVNEYLIQAAKLPILEELDSAPSTMPIPQETSLANFGSMWFAKMKLPGRELADDALWQIDEQGPMTEEDYGTIINKGWKHLKQDMFNRIGFEPAKLPAPDPAYMAELAAKVADLGKVSGMMAGGLLPMPSFEVLSGARKLPQFFRDLRRIPEKVKAAIEVMDKEQIDDTVEAIKRMPGAYGFIGGTRAGCDFINAKTFEEYYFPYYQKAVPVMQGMNVKTWFHQDGQWDLFLHYFTEFPKKQCIWDPDHITDYMKIKEVLGDRMCITGNVPPAVLAVGTPDDAYNYAKKQVADLGPAGFIMNSGCSVPPNAKRENVEAVILATLGK